MVAWNIRQGGGPRTSRILQAICKLGADVLVISEYRHTARHGLTGGLAELGFGHQALGPDPLRGYAGLLIASRPPIVAGSVRYDSAEDGRRFAHVLVNDWQIAGAYIPGSEPRAKERKPAFWQFLLEEAEPALRDVPAILLGDLNTDLHYREPGATLVCATEMAAFETRGWRDGWISRHPQARPPGTWWSPQAGKPYRLDHALLSPAAPRARSVEYLQQLEDGTVLGGIGGLSDHLPLIIDL